MWHSAVPSSVPCGSVTPLVRLGLIVAVGVALAHPAVQSPFYDGPDRKDLATIVEYKLDRSLHRHGGDKNLRAECIRLPASDKVFRCDVLVSGAGITDLILPMKATVLSGGPN